MSEHIKGPWKLGNTFRTHNAPTRFWETNIRSDYGFVALGIGASEEESKANAHIIAAAPELLKALVSLRSFMWSEGYADQTSEMAQADAAINNAEVTA